MIKENNYIKSSKPLGKDISEKESKDTTFLDEGIGKIYLTSKVKARLVLTAIENEEKPISVYELAKKIKITYNTLARICKDLEFVGLIKSHIEIGSNNRAVRLVEVVK